MLWTSKPDLNQRVVSFAILTAFPLIAWSLSCASKAPQAVQKDNLAITAEDGNGSKTVAEADKKSVEAKEESAAPDQENQIAEKKDLSSPKYVIQSYTEELKRIAGIRKQDEKTAIDSDKEAKIAEKVRMFFDFPALARFSLGKHWNRISDQERNEFSSLFINLVEDSYLKRSRDLVGEYDLSYGDQSVEGDKATVDCTVAREDADVTINYELHRIQNRWMIYNIILDGVDLIRNYQSQFNRIIAESSFNELLKKMRKKLNEDDDVEKML